MCYIMDNVSWVQSYTVDDLFQSLFYPTHLVLFQDCLQPSVYQRWTVLLRVLFWNVLLIRCSGTHVPWMHIIRPVSDNRYVHGKSVNKPHRDIVRERRSNTTMNKLINASMTHCSLPLMPNSFKIMTEGEVCLVHTSRLLTLVNLRRSESLHICLTFSLRADVKPQKYPEWSWKKINKYYVNTWV